MLKTYFGSVLKQLCYVNSYKMYSSRSIFLSLNHKSHVEEITEEKKYEKADNNVEMNPEIAEAKTQNAQRKDSDNDFNDINLSPDDLKLFYDAYVEYDKLREQAHKYSFPKLLRNSFFINLGDPKGKLVVGKIYDIIDNDLYIDIGTKFYCVCPKPIKYPGTIQKGTLVRVVIHDLELSTRFLGSTKDLTILEANCSIDQILTDQRLKEYNDDFKNIT